MAKLRTFLLAMTGFGNNAFRVLVDHPSIELVAVVTPTRQDSHFPYYECKPLDELVISREIALYEGLVLREQATHELIRQLFLDLIVVSTFPQIIPLTIIKLPSVGVINIHPSLLPKYRGTTPTNWVLINGENETGVTAHFIEDETVDRGPIISQTMLRIGPMDNDGLLRRKLAELSEKVLESAINAVLAKKRESFPQQEESKASYYRKRSLRDAEIDASQPLHEIQNRIRAMSPYPGASLTYKGTRYDVTEASAVEEGDYTGSSSADKDEIVVKVPSGAIRFTLKKEICREGRRGETAAALRQDRHPRPGNNGIQAMGKGIRQRQELLMEVIDLNKDYRFIDQYVNLRNSYVDLLLTYPVDISETKEWLKNEDIEIRGLISDDVLAGVVILYLKRGGEIAFFAKEKNRGIGGRLLTLIEDVARERKLGSIWGWVLADNTIAQRVFEKCGFMKEGVSEREYAGVIKYGVIFKKQVRHSIGKEMSLMR